MVILNSEPDLANGYLALYAGEKLAIELTDVVFRVNTTVTATAMMFSSQLVSATKHRVANAADARSLDSLLRRFLGRLCGDCRLLVLLSQLSIFFGGRSEFRSRRGSQSDLRRLSAFIYTFDNSDPDKIRLLHRITMYTDYKTHITRYRHFRRPESNTRCPG